MADIARTFFINFLQISREDSAPIRSNLFNLLKTWKMVIWLRWFSQGDLNVRKYMGLREQFLADENPGRLQNRLGFFPTINGGTIIPSGEQLYNMVLGKAAGLTTVHPSASRKYRGIAAGCIAVCNLSKTRREII